MPLLPELYSVPTIDIRISDQIEMIAINIGNIHTPQNENTAVAGFLDLESSLNYNDYGLNL